MRGPATAAIEIYSGDHGCQTAEYADCYGDYVRCAAEFSIGPCATDPAAEACVTCQENAGCHDNFASCNGFPRE